MDPLHYAFICIALWVLGMAGALIAWRALYRIYERWKKERDAAAAVARIEEQRRRIDKQLHNN